MTIGELQTILSDCGQQHVLRFYDDLSEASREKLLSQLSSVDWARLPELVEAYVKAEPRVELPASLQPAPSLPAQPENEERRELYAAAARHGRELLSQGKVAGFTVAGGQGTRLGYPGPKGTFPISPIRRKPLFQWFAESIARACEKYDSEIPWYIMTSPMNDSETREFFRKHAYFGLSEGQVFFLTQGTMPAIGLDGRLLLAAPDSLALSPDGHGGSLLAMRQSGALADMARRGIEYISYWQVDNPLVCVLDPLFLGLHSRLQAEMSCRGLVKTGPFEKLGNFCLIDDKMAIVEYSDMPEELAQATRPNGDLRFRVGSPAIHILDRPFVERLTAEGRLRLPFHRAVKKVPFVNANGDLVEPEEPNAVKLETFIFDALPLAANVLILEAARGEQFGPVKNPKGVDSVDSCRRLLVERAANWLEAAGVKVPRQADGSPDCTVELSPRTYLDPEDVRQQAAQLAPPKPGSREYYE